MGRFIHSCGVAWGATMTVLAVEGWAILIRRLYEDAKNEQSETETETKDTFDPGNKE